MGYPSADWLAVLAPVLLKPIELELEKLEPLDLLPLLLELDDSLDSTEILGPVPPPEFEKPGPMAAALIRQRLASARRPPSDTTPR